MRGSTLRPSSLMCLLLSGLFAGVSANAAPPTVTPSIPVPPSGDSGSNAAIQAMEGVYKKRFANSTVGGEKYQSEDILEIVKFGKQEIYFRLHLEFFNGHVCNLFGIARYVDGRFVFRQASQGNDGGCTLSFAKSDGSIRVSDVDGACRDRYCGARGGFNDVKFPLSSRRGIRYRKRLLASRQYRQAVEEFTRTHPLPK
jgi:hypothetical protein